MKKISTFVVIAFALVSISCAPTIKPVSKADTYPEFADVLSRLKSIELVKRGNIKIFGKAKLEKRGYIRVLHLKGSAFEMGYQHGTLLKKEIIERLKKRDRIEPYFGFSRKKRTLRYLRHIEAKIPSKYIKEIKGVAAALNVDYDTVLASKLIWELRKIGCTTVAANKGATVDSNIIYLRTMENPLKWHKFLEIMVIFYEPDNGNSFFSINGPGGVGVYSGMNEKQITIDDNMIPAAKEGFRRDGIPLTLFRRIIIQHANNIEDVQKFIESRIPSGPNNILITDGKVNEMRVYEVAGTSHVVRRPDNGILCSTNHPVALNLELKYRYEGSYERYNDATDYMKKHYGKIDSEKLIKFIKSDFMSELYDKRKKILQYIVIMAPKDLDFWVAVQKRSNKHASNNQFIKFNLLEELKR